MVSTPSYSGVAGFKSRPGVLSWFSSLPPWIRLLPTYLLIHNSLASSHSTLYSPSYWNSVVKYPINNNLWMDVSRGMLQLDSGSNETSKQECIRKIWNYEVTDLRNGLFEVFGMFCRVDVLELIYACFWSNHNAAHFQINMFYAFNTNYVARCIILIARKILKLIARHKNLSFLLFKLFFQIYIRL